EVGLTLPDGGLGDLVRRLGLAELLADLAIVHLRDLLAALHRVAKPHADRLEPAGGLRHDLDGRRADEAADHLDGFLERLPHGRGHADGQRLAGEPARPAWPLLGRVRAAPAPEREVAGAGGDDQNQHYDPLPHDYWPPPPGPPANPWPVCVWP